MVSDERVYIGPVEAPILSFDNTSLESVSCENSVDVLGNELITDIIEVSVFFDDEDNVLRSMSYGTPIVYTSDGNRVGTYYLAKVERTGKTKYLIHGTSLIGLLEKETFYGGMYDGDYFKDVIEDILLTDGIDNTRYSIYKPTCTNVNSEVTKRIFNKEPTYDFYKYRVHADFSVIRVLSTSSSYQLDDIEGTYWSGYSIRLYARSDDGYANVYYGLEIVYGSQQIDVYGTETEVRLFGDGTRFIVDLDPMNGILTVDTEYVKYRNPSVTGTTHFETSIELYTPTEGNHTDFSGAFGGFNSIGSTMGSWRIQKIWNSDIVYDERGQIVKDAKFAVNDTTGEKYVFNAAGTTVVANQYLDPYGSPLGTVGELTRYKRDTELMKSINYANGIDMIRVYGWLKAETKREALHEILFANNVNLVKSGRNEIIFMALPKQVEAEIDYEDMYDGGKDSEVVPAKSVNVVEHGYTTAGISNQVIFDNSDSTIPEGDYSVLFQNAPISGDITAEGITLKMNNCNAAIVSGKGKLYGAPYNHSRSNISFAIDGIIDGADVSVPEIGLITSVNSNAVLNKLKAYYSGGVHVIDNGLKYKGERCGAKYGLYNPFDEKVYAYLSKCSTKTSTFVKANTQFVSGFDPASAGGYTDYVILTYGDVWNVPDGFWENEGASIRVNIIGKGRDGSAGEAGKDGTAGKYEDYNKVYGVGGDGGKGGEGGEGGNVFSVTITDINVMTLSVFQSSYETIVRVYDENGSQLSSYSSATGGKMASGFLNYFDGLYYGAHGEKGIDGGKGGNGGFSSWRTGIKGEDVPPMVGGSGRTELDQEVLPETDQYYHIVCEAEPAGGGGASIVENGGDCAIKIGSSSWIDGRQFTYQYMEGGKGADGGEAIEAPSYGCGGNGGNGGGGGGGGSTYLIAEHNGDGYHSGAYYRPRFYGTNGGAGGAAGTGGSGKNGCAIIFF